MDAKIREQARLKQVRIEQNKKALTWCLDSFFSDLRYALKEKSLKGKMGIFQKITDIRGKIDNKIRPMLDTPSATHVTDFKAWFNEMLLEEKKQFKEEPSVWRNTIHPALMKLLGGLCAIILSPALPFSKSARHFVGSFFNFPHTLGDRFEDKAREKEEGFSRLLVYGG